MPHPHCCKSALRQSHRWDPSNPLRREGQSNRQDQPNPGRQSHRSYRGDRATLEDRQHPLHLEALLDRLNHGHRLDPQAPEDRWRLLRRARPRDPLHLVGLSARQDQLNPGRRSRQSYRGDRATLEDRWRLLHLAAQSDRLNPGCPLHQSLQLHPAAPSARPDPLDPPRPFANRPAPTPRRSAPSPSPASHL